MCSKTVYKQNALAAYSYMHHKAEYFQELTGAYVLALVLLGVPCHLSVAVNCNV